MNQTEERKAPVGIVVAIIVFLLLIMISVVGYLLYTQGQSLKSKEDIIQKLNQTLQNENHSEPYNQYVARFITERNQENYSEYQIQNIQNNPNDWYSLTLESNGNLYLEVSTSVQKKLNISSRLLLSENVLKSYILPEGKNPTYHIYFILEDGTVSKLSLEDLFREQREYQETDIQKNYKELTEIVEIVSAKKEEDIFPIFINFERKYRV